MLQGFGIRGLALLRGEGAVLNLQTTVEAYEVAMPAFEPGEPEIRLRLRIAELGEHAGPAPQALGLGWGRRGMTHAHTHRRRLLSPCVQRKGGCLAVRA